MLTLPKNPAVNLVYELDHRGGSYEILIGYYENRRFLTCEESNSIEMPRIKVSFQDFINRERLEKKLREKLEMVLNEQVQDIEIFINDRLNNF